MRRLFLFPVLVVLVVMDTGQKTNEQFTRMLTQKKWTLVQYGFDENENGAIDFFEDRMDDCNRDDTYVFYTDGTGRYDDHLLSCGNGVEEMSLQWHSWGDETLISLPTGKANMKFLSNDKLILTNRGIDPHGQPVNQLRVLMHDK